MRSRTLFSGMICLANQYKCTWRVNHIQNHASMGLCPLFSKFWFSFTSSSKLTNMQLTEIGIWNSKLRSYRILIFMKKLTLQSKPISRLVLSLYHPPLSLILCWMILCTEKLSQQLTNILKFKLQIMNKTDKLGHS